MDIPGASPADPGHERVDGGQARVAHPAAAHTQPGSSSPATAAVPARSTAAGEQAIADLRESGPEDQAAAIVALSRLVMIGLPWCRARWKIEDAMPTDLTVILEHRPGELARLAEITGEAGVTIHGLAAFTGEGRGVVHVLLDDQAVTGCRAALERAGMGIADEREVFVIDVEDRPAALGELTRRLAEANVNVDLAYTTFTGGKIVIATDDVGSARAVLP